MTAYITTEIKRAGAQLRPRIFLRTAIVSHTRSQNPILQNYHLVDRPSILCVSVARPYGGYANEEDRTWAFQR
ncbi:hypothetical protein QUA81_09725 [Microcoleus sp. F6_B4]